ncbi:hypothetical protein INT46_000331 [Mucor plumbeus]|uniref:E3 ubiquitin protein ligase n=1 Tax=Mucor plumbeus TaxID=97098 RepID=A0A8H7VBW9_9FUNG|nr:hypothetical protein INT46_000331 [Mucor plumbeus]
MKNENKGIKSTVPSRPPLKKRFVSGSSQTATASTVISPPPLPRKQVLITTLPDNLSKKELLEHMYSTKNAYIQEKQHLIQLKENNVKTNALYGVIRLQLKMLRDQFAAFPTINSLPEKNDDESIVNQLKQTCLQITEHIQAWNTQIGHLMSDNFRNADVDERCQILSKYMQLDIEQLAASSPDNTINSLKHDNEMKSDLIAKTSSDIMSIVEQLVKTNNSLEDCIQSIAVIQKRQDRLQSNVVSSVFGTVSASTSTAVVNEDQEKATEQQSNMPPPIPPQRTQMEELAEFQQLLEFRNQELAKNQQDREQLHFKLDGHLDKFSLLSSDYIKSNSIYVNHLQSMIELEHNLIEYYDQRRIRLLKEEDNFTRERRQLIDQQNLEMASREAALITETKRLQDTLIRVRHQRDELQQTLERRIMEEKEARAYNDQIVQFAEEQQSRMVELEKDTLHKRQAMETMTLLPEEYLNYRKLKLQIEKTHGILHALRQQKNDQPDIQSFMKLPMMNILNQLIQQRHQFELLIDFYEKTELDLYAQMDCDGSAIERQIPIIKSQINDKTANQQKLQAEINKFVSTNAKLVSKNHENDTQYAQHRHQVQLNDKSITHLEEKVASIETKVIEKEKNIRQLETNVEHYRLAFDDISQECSELQSNQERYETHLAHLQDMAREKNKMLEQEMLLVQQAKNEYERIMKTWNLIQQGENPASQELIDEVEELRAYFKCSTCKTRRRECILTSCMHTFCNECIRIRLETRQRRCPSCAITFGASDVKDIYLYGK